MIPKNLSREHVLRAIKEIDKIEIPRGRRATKFTLMYKGREYPPKYVVGLASKYASGAELSPKEFSGGAEVNSCLLRLGFKVVGSGLRRPVKTHPSGRSRADRHDERCSDCKNTIIEMLRKLYGQVKVDHKLEVSAELDAHGGKPHCRALQAIHASLVRYRGYKHFVRVKTLPRCDLFVPRPGFVVELDESQHFTAARLRSLSNYPPSLRTRFPVSRWMDLCREIDAKDNQPEYRDEQRAWYDTLRDFLPLILGLGPTARLYMGDRQWCAMNPESRVDLREFRRTLEGRSGRSVPRSRQPMRFKAQRISPTGTADVDVWIGEDPFLTRIIYAGRRDEDAEDPQRVLQTVCEILPEGSKTDFLMTCGAFLHFPWPKELRDVSSIRQEDSQVLGLLSREAERRTREVLNGGLQGELAKRFRYVTLGNDCWKGPDGFHVEFVHLVDLRRGTLHATGKFYPTTNQQSRLVRNPDLRSHFVELDGTKVMILGCHDLTVFNPRARVNARGWRRRLIDEFTRLSKRERPEVVLQHPHGTDSTRIWAQGWGGVRRTLPSVVRYASAGTYRHDRTHKARSPLDRVLDKTRLGETVDVVIWA
jgi:copper chaperone CopZ